MVAADFPFVKPFPTARMRTNIFKRDATATVTEDDAIRSVEGTPQTSVPASEDVELAPNGAADEAANEKPDNTAQGGVRQIEAITLTWTRTHVIIAYAW